MLTKVIMSKGHGLAKYDMISAGANMGDTFVIIRALDEGLVTNFEICQWEQSKYAFINKLTFRWLFVKIYFYKLYYKYFK